MFNSWVAIIIICILPALPSYAQNCSITIEGQVLDEGTELPLEFVNVFFSEISAGATTSKDGFFKVENICAGEYHVVFSHIGCASKEQFIEVSRDSFLRIFLPHTGTSLSTVTIAGKEIFANNQATSNVGRSVIENNTNRNLSELIEQQTGVSLLKNGTGIAKPVVHGMYGNRLPILNNGIVQSGQQWGNDHSPEIDPTTADKITIVKGANALEYLGAGLGSVVLVEPSRIEREPHLHGQANYTYEGNGRGNTFNTRLGKYTSDLAWRINGTYKKYGDRHTPDYFLNNTGVYERNLSLQLEKSWSDKIFVDLYASTFNTTLGVLRGSHIGNLTDLEQALERDVPFSTEPDFSYGIDAPKQEVAHHLVKLKAKYFISDTKIVQLVLAGQINDRKEFDVRRSGRSELPALSLLQYNFVSDISYKIDFDERWTWKIGNQNTITDNTNNPETGILPLIPDYISFASGVFTTVSKQTGMIQVDFGLRYDYQWQNVAAISSTLPREIIRFDNRFGNVSSLSTIKYEIASKQSLTFGAGYGTRNPAINELYSSGLHQGVSGIELGDPELETERSLKFTLEHKWTPSSTFSISTLAYYQDFADYIFLDPQDELQLTIRGAFPVFKYQQTDAVIYGLDISSQFSFGRNIFATAKYSYLRGNDVENDLPLIFMPANSLRSSITYRKSKPINLFSKVKLEDLEIGLTSALVFRQNHILEEQDFALPPPSYFLVGVETSAHVHTEHNKVRLFVRADNLFNVRYRNYLNRQRYFADDLGRSISGGLSLKF